MKILCISPSYMPAIKFGGTVSAIHGLNKALCKLGHEVMVYTTDAGIEKEVKTGIMQSKDGVNIIYFDYNRKFDFLGSTGWQYCPDMLAALRKSVVEYDIAHLHMVWNYTTVAASYACRKFNVPYMVSPHGTLLPYGMKRRGWKKKPYYWLVARKALMSAYAMCFFSEDELHYCNKILGLNNKHVVIPNGIDLPDFTVDGAKKRVTNKYPELNCKTIILFLGRLHPVKGLDILLNAYGEIAAKRNDVHLVIAGGDEGGYINTVRHLIKINNLSGSVILTGIVNGQDKFDLLSACDIFVLPSYAEGFSIAVLEAMAHELPVIITKQCNFHEASERGAALEVKPDKNHLKDAIMTLIDNPNLRAAMGHKGKSLIKEKYTWDIISMEFDKLYTEAFDKNSILN